MVLLNELFVTKYWYSAKTTNNKHNENTIQTLQKAENSLTLHIASNLRQPYVDFMICTYYTVIFCCKIKKSNHSFGERESIPHTMQNTQKFSIYAKKQWKIAICV